MIQGRGIRFLTVPALTALTILFRAWGGQTSPNIEAVSILERMKTANEAIVDMRCTFTFEVTKDGKKHPAYRTVFRYRKDPETIHLTFTDRAKGRQVLFVKGRNGGKMKVRPEGFWRFTVISLDPVGDRAMEGAIDPITAQGFANIVRAAEEILRGPGSSNECEISIDWSANGESGNYVEIRVCGQELGEMAMLVDKDTYLPFRIMKRRGNDEAVYTYEDIQLNPGIPDAEYSLSRRH